MVESFRKASKDVEAYLGMFSKSDVIRFFRHLLDAYFSNKKAIIGTLLALLLLLYSWPRFFRGGSVKYAANEASKRCLSQILERYSEGVGKFDISVYDQDEVKPGSFLPFIGNGYYGISPGLGELRIKHQGSLSVPLSATPFIDVSVQPPTSAATAFVTEYKRGVVTHLQAYSIEGECVEISSQFYFHRKFTSLLVQQVEVKNPTSAELSVALHRENTSWKDVTSILLKIEQEDVTYQLLSDVVNHKDLKKRVYVVTLAMPQLPSSFSVSSGGSLKKTFLNAISVSEPAQIDVYSNHRNLLEKNVQEAIKIGSRFMANELLALHTGIWNKLMRPGFSISFSKAPQVLNGDRINATVYYLMCNTIAPLHENDIPESALSAATSALVDHEICSSYHTTLLYPGKLWPDIVTTDQIAHTSNLWKLTLLKHGCERLLEAGADGLIQALMLSFGALKFTKHHLEFNTHPSDLHRDYYFRHVLYRLNESVNIAVEVNEENRAEIFAWRDEEEEVAKSSFFACDAGCLDQPIKLTGERKRLPVKLTEPVTAILYITDNQGHIRELKHTIHVKEVNEASAHEHAIISMHKHGHSLGGLPTFFWVSFALLLVVFHLFLFKLIYDEYCKQQQKFYPGGRYSV